MTVIVDGRLGLLWVHQSWRWLHRVRLLQPRILGFGSNQDRNIGVGVFPEREEILIRGPGFGGVALQCVGTSETEMGEYTCRTIPQHPAMVEDFLKFGGCGRHLLRAQISLGANVDRIQAGVSRAAT